VKARLRSWRTWFIVTCLAILVAGGLYVPLPYFVEAPGRLLTLGGCVRVESEDSVPVRGDYMLTSVNLRRASPFSLARVAVSPAASLRPADRVVRNDVGDRDHFASQRRVFAQSAQLAAALGLQRAGFTADPNELIGDGALVTGVVEGSPAYGVLRGGDVIVAIDGVPIATGDEVRTFVDDTEPLVVRFTRDGSAHEVRLSPHLLSVDGQERPALGLRLDTLNSRVNLPVPVSVTSGRIGGPSAGLMIALAVYDQSDPSTDLAAGRRIAGTGTLTGQGAVGRIGGIDLKALAAHRRDADIFLAPESQAEAAKQRLPRNSRMQVVPVSTFDGAVQHLLETAGTDVRGRPQTPLECPVRPAA
jgi:Lon-like protease